MDKIVRKCWFCGRGGGESNSSRGREDNTPHSLRLEKYVLRHGGGFGPPRNQSSSGLALQDLHDTVDLLGSVARSFFETPLHDLDVPRAKLGLRPPPLVTNYQTAGT